MAKKTKRRRRKKKKLRAGQCSRILATTGNRCKNRVSKGGKCIKHQPFLSKKLRDELRGYMGGRLPRRKRRRRNPVRRNKCGACHRRGHNRRTCRKRRRKRRRR